MYTVANDIKSFAESLLGSDFYIEVIKFNTKTNDPYEKKTKNRFELRNSLYHFLKEKKKFIFEDALDLRNVPQKIAIKNKDYYSSLTHTDDVGVFTFDSFPVGVDIESPERIRKEIVARVSTKSELTMGPNFQIAWSIKEASFKAIPFIVQPKTISDIKIQSISPFSNAQVPGFEACLFTAIVKKSPAITVEGFCLYNNLAQLCVAKAIVK